MISMNLGNLMPDFLKRAPQPRGIGKNPPEREMTEAEGMLLREIQARLSGLGEPPQLGYRITLADIQKAIRMSELGEPYWMNALNRDMIENDPHLQAEIGKRIMSFMGESETIEPCDPDNKEDVKAKEFIEDIIKNCDNWRDGNIHLAQGHIWPVSGAEKIFAQVTPEEKSNYRHPTTWRLKKLHPIPWPLFTYKVAYWNVSGVGGSPDQSMARKDLFNPGTGSVPINNPPGITAYHGIDDDKNSDVYIWNPQDWHPDLRFYGTLQNGMIDWTLSTGYKADKIRHVIHSAQVSTSGMRPNFGSVLRSLIPYWFYKKNLLDWYMRGMERYGSPFVVGQANMANKNVSDILTKAFDQASKLNALIVPPGTKVELKEIQVSGMSDGFAKGIEVLNTEMTKAILGQTLSTSSKGSGMMGGSGVADLHGDVKEQWTQFDKRAFCDMQGQQIFTPILRLNGYSGNCRSERGGMSTQQAALLSKTIQSLYLAGKRVSEDDDQKLSNLIGLKMESFEPQPQDSPGEKNDKSKSDRKNPGK
jgi:hypothetical protein